MKPIFYKNLWACLIVVGLFTGGVAISANETAVGISDYGVRVIVDSRCARVSIPRKIERVITVSDGLIEGVMTVIGVEDRLVGIGSSCLEKTDYRFCHPSEKGESICSEDGMHTITFLRRQIAKLPQIAFWNTAPNYEKIASLAPDLMIVRVGSCWHGNDSDQIPKSIKTIESLGIPLVVLHSPNTYAQPDIRFMHEEIRIIGKIFQREARAEKLIAYLESSVNVVRARTKDIPEKARPRILFLGLSSKARENGGAGTVFGLGTIDSYLLQDVVHGINAFQERGYFKILGTEQILSLNPDAILLPTAWGHHPPQELYGAPYYAYLRELDAVKNRRVASLPFTPCNCDKRLEYPIDIMVMAKTAYPDRFADIDLTDWMIDFYRNVYGVDEHTAAKLRAVQWMDWTVEN
ncbi:ABC transporter substrate-binding protein [Desulfosarcina ovata subsp. sediminis]|uniref:ABC transporter substrate-binding protein n=1 Tax=Desulfosarcina ovata subsp. sediminis TaxID=885957 RepID=A0A5K7ZJD9_9BACT|nr:ABC transporter substrate-binding protein [Desulfosarcina ovata]BBO82348.1 ABC transporter substrate-binding protein [Desulfosarcina ovata subsp. sediminis]